MSQREAISALRYITLKGAIVGKYTGVYTESSLEFFDGNPALARIK